MVTLLQSGFGFPTEHRQITLALEVAIVFLFMYLCNK